MAKRKTPKVYQVNKYQEFTKEVLLYLATAGAIFIAAGSPYFALNITREIIKHRKEFKKKWTERKITRAVQRLKANRVIILSQENGKFKAELTKKGKRIVEEIKFQELKIEKPKTWDRKWRVIIFDIPESKNRIGRDALREKLKKMDFYLLQKSVWVYPYPCKKEVQFLTELFEITPHVNIITAEKIYDDIKLKKHFKLF